MNQAPAGPGREEGPSISVVIPTRNRADLVPRAIRSVLAQRFAGFELIVADDASTDGTAAVVEGFGDPRIRYVRREVSGGSSAARNTGIRAARGRYVCFLDDDDEFLPGYLEAVWEAFESAAESVGFLWCGVEYVDDRPGGDPLPRPKLFSPGSGERSDPYFRYVEMMRVGSGYGFAIRRSVVDHVGLFDEELRAVVDSDFIVRLVQRYDFISLPKVLVRVHLHGGPMLSPHSPKRAEACERIIAKHLDDVAEYPAVTAALYHLAGTQNYCAGRRMRGLRYLAHALLANPLQLQTWRFLAVTTLFLGNPSPRLRLRARRLLSR